MVVNIPINRLRRGAYVVRYGEGTFECPVVEFDAVVRNTHELDTIVQSGASWVTVDTERSRLVPAAFEKELREPVALKTGLAPLPHVPYGDEIRVARRAYARGLEAMNGLLESVRRDAQPDISAVSAAADEIASSAGRNYHACSSLPVMRSHGHIANHSVNVAVLSSSFAVFLGSPPERAARIGLAGMLHDIGKMRIDPALLDKPGRLTREEYRLVRRHTLEGYLLLQDRSDIPADVLSAVLDHHERPDGTGYPRGRSGDEVSRAARMLAVTDVYDALISDRPYRRAMAANEVLGLMHRGAGSQFDKELFTAFVCFVGLYPVGSLVRLWNGSHAVVSAVNHRAPHKPVVRVCYDARFRSMTPDEVDLSRCGQSGGVECCLNPERLGVNVEALLAL